MLREAKIQRFIRSGLCVAGLCVGGAVAQVVAGGGSNCTAEITCNGLTISAEPIPPCPVGRVCSGQGACEPEPWVIALCIPKPTPLPE